MTIQDDQAARVMAQAHEPDSAESTESADDLRSILGLIASQLQDADRRQTEVLDDMHRRLAQMGNDARATRSRVPEAFAPAFERIQDGIELLAQLVAGAEADAAGTGGEPPVACNDEDPRAMEAAAYPERAAEPAGLPSVSSIFPPSEPALPSASFEENEFASAGDHDPDDDMVITDNAADRFEFDEPSEFAAFADVSEPASPTAEPTHRDAEAHEPQQRNEPPVFANSDFLEDDHSDSGENWDEVSTWHPDEADALARVYEAHQQEDATRAAGLSHEPAPEAEDLADTAMTYDQPADEHFAPVAEANPAQEEIEMLPQDDQSRDFYEAAVADPVPAPVIEQAWLEERFAEIAAKIEESILELRDDQALNSLSDRFGEFEERIGLALEDVATRHDVDALKSAEAQIDSMVGYFERIEAQLGRVDSLEAQMEMLLERFSDDNLAQLLPAHDSVPDVAYSSLAETAAENVAQRFLTEFANGAIGADGDKEALADMREALEAFAGERRERDEESANMLDTIQQALLRVLDRVEELEQAYEAAPMASPLDEDAAEAGAPLADETGPYAYEDETEDYDAPAYQETPIERQRAEPDYQQTRLEYPAAVRGERAEDEPRRPAPHIELDDQFDDEPQHHDVEAFDQDALSDPAGRPMDEQSYDEPARAAAPVPEAFEAEQAGSADAEPAQQPEIGALPAASANPIDRLRQEFIADARNARERASQQAALEAARPEEAQTAKKKFSLPGLSALGAKVRGGAASEAATAPAPAAPLAVSREALSARAPVTEEDEGSENRSRFALPRSKLLVGAVIVLFATAGALLMMRSPSKPITDAAPPAIEQTVEQTPSGPQLTGPEVTAPETKGTDTSDRRSSLDGGRVYDGEFNYDGPGEDASRSMNQALAGLAVTDLDKAPNPAAYAKAQRQQRVAKMSSELGAAAAYAVPANLIEEEPATNSATVPAASVARAGHSNNLDLPPATVGPLSLRLAAAKGDPSAQFEVAARLAGGTGTQQDLKGAVKWYQLAASQGFAQAQYRLGTLYERGLGVDKDLARAGVWYQRAASKGNIKAMHNLAVVSAGRAQGGPDYETAAKWFESAAQYGLSDSQFNLAVLYESGLGVEANLSRAYVYYSLAAAKGDAQAKTRRDAVRAMLSNSALEAAERMVQGFRPKRADRIVNDARVAGEDWKKRADGGY